MARLLVVDDKRDNRYLLRSLLEGHGHSVVEASDGQEALDLGRRSPPDCVVTDLLMPVMDGFTLCQEWARDERLVSIPIVVCTATYTDPADEQLALRLGARRFICKPAEPEVFVAAIDQVLGAAARGELAPPAAPTDELEVGRLALYNERLVRKLERRTLALSEAEASLAGSERRHRNLFEHSLDAILLTVPDGRILAANPAACQLFGRTEAELCALGRQGLVSATDPRVQALLEERARDGQATATWTMLRKDGSKIEVESSSARFDSAEGPRTCMILRDVTELRRMEHLLAEGARIGRLGYWSRDFVGSGQITWSDEALKLLDLSRDQGPFGMESHLARVHPDDREKMRRLHKQAGSGDSPFSVEYRIVRADGEVRWLHSQGEVEQGPDGRPLRASGVFRDITEEKAARVALERHGDDLERQVRARTAELLAARDRAEAADRVKSAFLATMSHELRTPLNSVVGFTGILLQELPGPLNDEQKKQLGMVRSSGRHLLALINDVLDISKIEAGQLELHREWFDLGDTLRSAVALLAAAAQAKGVALELCELSAQVRLQGDRRRLEQVLLNLLGNAVKFTDQGRICVDCRVSADEVEISVTDTGIGIPPEQLGRVFEAFHQVGAGLARQYEGTGLGLAICKRLVEAMGGRIRVESEAGTGSTFRVTLPVGRGEQAQ